MTEKMVVITNLKFKLILIYNFVVPLVFGTIIRDDKSKTFSAMFNINKPGKIKGTPILLLKNMEYHKCILTCSRHDRCEAINYSLHQKMCELLDIDFRKGTFEFISGWSAVGTTEYRDGDHNSESLENNGATSSTDIIAITSQALTSTAMISSPLVITTSETVTNVSTTNKMTTESHLNNETVTYQTTQPDIYRNNYSCQYYFQRYCITFNERNVSNIALDGEASHINGNSYNSRLPNYAIDGDMNTHSHTDDPDKKLNPWWEVKLPKAAKIYEVLIYPRHYTPLPDRFRNGTLTVRVETEGEDIELSRNMDLFNVSSKRIESMVIGTILKIQLFRETETFLHLFEVQIYGEYLEGGVCDGTRANESDSLSCQHFGSGQCVTGNGVTVKNIALEGHAEQYPGTFGQHYASNAIDGLVDTFSHTELLASEPWIEITLNKTAIVYGIRIVVILNLPDRERFVNGILSIRNEMENKEAICATNINIFHYIPSNDTAEKTFSFITVGKIMKIQIRRDLTTYLHLREVEIYGEYLI